jgi:hypothetical protein
MKKLLFILIPSLLLSLILFFSFHYIVKARSQKGALQVTSSPESKIYLGDKYIGQTPLCKCEASDMLMAGEYTIRLVPVDDSLPQFQEKVTISEGVLTVVDRKFGKDSLSEGSIISLSPLTDKDKTQLVVVSFPEGASVALDENDIGKTPISHDNPTESDHLLKITKSGYKDKEIRIRTPLGYKLTVAAYLSISDTLSGITPTPASPSATLSTSPTTTPSPSSSLSQTKVRIIDTPTGFLRVRQDSSVASPEIDRINPGQTYPLVQEEDGWYQIKLSDGKLGWISSQYAKKE